MRSKLFLYYFWVENKRFFRQWQNVFFIYIYPLLLVGLFGMIFQPKVRILNESTYLDYALPGYLSIIVLSSLFLGVFGEFLSWRNLGVVQNFSRTPLNFWWLTSLTAIANITHALLAQLSTLFFAVFVFKINMPPIFLFLGYQLLLILSVYSFCYFFHVFVQHGQLNSIVRFSLFFTVMFLSGAAVPIELFPPFLQKVAQFFPLAYGIDLLKPLWASTAQRSAQDNVSILVIFSLSFLFSSWIIRSLRLFIAHALVQRRRGKL